jgi:hypothetical protein
MGALMLCTCLFMIAIQLLLDRSKKNSGLLFAPSIAKLPLSSVFQYQHLPTILFVLYSILWTWVDSDVRRLEPFYQMSTVNGVSGKESVLLHYPVDFLATVPIKAFRMR